jgi:dTDP-glucose 4,6-dehydratase
MEMPILVTGGLGFIGAAYVKHVLATCDEAVVVLDAEYYAANYLRLPSSNRLTILRAKVQGWPQLLCELQQRNIDTVVHFAAASHVTHSFAHPLDFLEDNVVGCQILLECCRIYGHLQCFLLISTDEVYGDGGPFLEDAELKPTNPYSASKACADIICRTYGRCYGLPMRVVRSNNVVGCGQHREKLVPTAVAAVVAGHRVPIEGSGQQTRCFLHLQDMVQAIEIVRQRGTNNEVYNVGVEREVSVVEVVRIVLEQLRPQACVSDWIQHVPDRPYQDQCYRIDSSKLRALGWYPALQVEDAIRDITSTLLPHISTPLPVSADQTTSHGEPSVEE